MAGDGAVCRSAGRAPGRTGRTLADFTPAICIEAGVMPWGHRDPFDRLLAATALDGSLPLVSADTVFDGIVSRHW